MIADENPKSFPYAVASVYGKEPFDLEGDALDEFEAAFGKRTGKEAGNEKYQRV
jgi:hypothetical protein